MEELSSETMSEQCLETLIRAAKISPYITERTIGADIENVKDCKSDSFSNKKKLKSKLNKTMPEKSSKVSSFSSVYLNSSFQDSDYKSFSSSLLLREAEANRKKNLQKQFIELWEKQISAIYPSKSQQDRLITEREKWLEEKRRSDSFIEKEAEKQTNQMIKECENEIASIGKQANRTIQEISIQAIARYQNPSLYNLSW